MIGCGCVICQERAVKRVKTHRHVQGQHGFCGQLGTRAALIDRRRKHLSRVEQHRVLLVLTEQRCADGDGSPRHAAHQFLESRGKGVNEGVSLQNLSPSGVSEGVSLQNISPSLFSLSLSLSHTHTHTLSLSLPLFLL